MEEINVVIAGWSAEDRGSISGRSKRFISPPKGTDRLWGSTSLQSEGSLA